MKEVKVRIAAIDLALAGDTRLPGPIVREFCYLQLRMICELIAFCCLIAHGDIEKAKKLKKEYSAGAIMNALENLHPDFYPVPVIRTKRPNGFWHLERATLDHLKKADLITLNAKCGDVLHRGTLKKLLAGKIPVQTNFPEIVSWREKIINLLNHHSMVTVGNRLAFLCVMSIQGDPENVQVMLAEALSGPPEAAE